MSETQYGYKLLFDWFFFVYMSYTNRQTSSESASLPQYDEAIGKPRMSPLLSLNTSAVIRYLICVYASHFFAGRPYLFNQTLRTANKF